MVVRREKREIDDHGPTLEFCDCLGRGIETTIFSCAKFRSHTVYRQLQEPSTRREGTVISLPNTNGSMTVGIEIGTYQSRSYDGMDRCRIIDFGEGVAFEQHRKIQFPSNLYF